MNEKTEIIKKWIKKGDHDLGTAIITYTHIPKYSDTIAFHCQQAVEKYLKSYLIHLGLKVHRTHDLVFLLEIINQKDKIQKEWLDKISVLADYAIEIRYPDQTIELTDEEISEAIGIAKEFRKIITEKLNISFGMEK